MKMQRFLHKPEYFFNPAQVLRRVSAFFRPVQVHAKVKTPWGDIITINESETIGRSLQHMGVYDLVLTECLWRLASPGDRALDIGANIGYFSSLLCHRTGPTGKVLSFEPHPLLFERLNENLQNQSQCHLHNLALSEKKGSLSLFIPTDFSGNEGTATLERGALKNGHSKEIPVTVEVLDEVMGAAKVNLIKIDVEGHEISVFKGAQRTLQNTDHVLFEDFLDVKSPAIEFLKRAGFEVFRIKKEFWGPRLVSVEDGRQIPLWEPPNYLATRKISEVQEKLAPRGWQSLL